MKNTKKISKRKRTRTRTRTRTRKYGKKSLKRKVKGGAPNRVTVDSYMELGNIIKNIPDDSRIWIVKKGENKSLYESNKKNIIESLYSHGITKDNISNYEFNIL
jgi:hypothetical protein